MTASAGRIALITGAGSGMGLETARLLARDGATVVLLGRRQRVLDTVAATIRAEGGTALPLAADVTRAEDVTRVVERVHAE
ncbi:SDR family NAD(P)-dependent oxidoreductase, partial [Streptomyces albiflaviniger]|nr:SDR family NAD(P)-dependent oxidoreductase [Streptomyces albiflaviniger]